MVLMHSIMALAAAHRPPEADTCAANAFLNYTNLGNCHYSTILSLSGLEYSCSLSLEFSSILKKLIIVTLIVSNCESVIVLVDFNRCKVQENNAKIQCLNGLCSLVLVLAAALLSVM